MRTHETGSPVTQRTEHAPPEAARGAGVAAASALLSQGPPASAAFGRLLEQFPAESAEILRFLHSTLGNGFVQQVLSGARTEHAAALSEAAPRPALAAKQEGRPARRRSQAGAERGGESGDWAGSHPAVFAATLAKQRALLMARKAELETWDDKAKARFALYFGSTDEAAKEVIATRIQRELDLNAQMTPSNFTDARIHLPDTFAYVNRDDTATHTVYVDSMFAKAPNQGMNSKAGTISHEMSHFTDVGSTEDVAYGVKGSKALALKDPDQALRNADSFEYYLEGVK